MITCWIGVARACLPIEAREATVRVLARAGAAAPARPAPPGAPTAAGRPGPPHRAERADSPQEVAAANPPRGRRFGSVPTLLPSAWPIVTGHVILPTAHSECAAASRDAQRVDAAKR